MAKQERPHEFQISTNSETLKMTVSINKGKRKLAQVEMRTREANRIAGGILAAAEQCYKDSGLPPPTSENFQKHNLIVIGPSGTGVGPGQTESTKFVVLYFGDTALGIELSNALARKLGRDLLAVTENQTRPH